MNLGNCESAKAAVALVKVSEIVPVAAGPDALQVRPVMAKPASFVPAAVPAAVVMAPGTAACWGVA